MEETTVYSATKVFTWYFLKALKQEYKDIDMLAVAPENCRTKKNKEGEIQPEEHAEKTVSKLGIVDQTWGSFESFLLLQWGLLPRYVKKWNTNSPFKVRLY